ncbi:MAG TPA: adenylate/guanylate cyclase domain-containing protein [Gemmatimonadota bacterium]|nr:adenylate/guanylate cyclase domain-containing protein [Gemmatimonadota bacterium]
MTTLQHHLTAVWFADVVGYTRLASEDDSAALRLIQRFQSSSRAAAERHDGRIVKFLGDGALAEFASTEAAVRGALALLEAFAKESRSATGESHTLRIGIHVGDVASGPDGDLYGDGVNIAARLQAEAEPGQIVASEDVWRQLRARRGLRFEPLGERTLKGIAAPVDVYAIEMAEDSSAWLDVPDAHGEGTATSSAAESRPASRWSSGRLFRILALYLVAATLVFLGTNALRDAVGFPGWISWVALVLLAIGLGIVLSTAWVQAHPRTADRVAKAHVPGKWDLALGQLGRSVGRGEMPHLTWGRALFGGLVAFSLLFGAAGLYVVIQDRGRSFSPAGAIAEDAAPGLAVLPFTVNGPGLDVWREGVIDLVSANIDGAGGLRAIDGRTVLARWSEVVEGSATPDLEDALEVGRRTGARYALLGSATALGSEVRLVADVYDLSSGASLGQTQVQGAPDSVYSLVDRLSIGVLETVLADKPDALPQVDLARVTTTSLPALKAYLEAEGLYRRSDFDAAIPLFRQAVEADSTFALAQYRLSLAYGWTDFIGSEPSTLALEAAARFAERLPEREAILVRATMSLDRGSLDGLEPLRQGVRKYPDDVELWFTLGETYYHNGELALSTDAQHDEAWARAIELDPGLAPLYIHPTEVAFMRADSARASELAARYVQLAPNGQYADDFRHALALLWGDEASRARALAAVDTLASDALGNLVSYTTHPPFHTISAEIATRLRQREIDQWFVRIWRAHVTTGDLASAFASLDDPRMRRDVAELQLFRMHELGIPVGAERLVELRSFGPADTVPGNKAFLVAVLAAEEGRWQEFDQASDRLRRDAQRMRAQNDTIGVRYVDGLIQGADGYAAWRRGETEKAETLLRIAQRQATGPDGYDTNFVLRYWLGMLALEDDRPADAQRYFASYFWTVRSLVADRLGQAYEAGGEREKAREAYELFVQAWENADPVLQPRVEAARQALLRLGFGRRG